MVHSVNFMLAQSDSEQLREYLPVLLLILVAIGVCVAMMTLSVLLGQKGKTNEVKDSAYECGMKELSSPHSRFSVKFYVVAMLFILFDIEVVFLYPWAVIFKNQLQSGHATMIFWSMISFLGILTVGFFYVLKKGALDWTRR